MTTHWGDRRTIIALKGPDFARVIVPIGWAPLGVDGGVFLGGSFGVRFWVEGSLDGGLTLGAAVAFILRSGVANVDHVLLGGSVGCVSAKLIWCLEFDCSWVRARLLA